ncbi:MAG: 2,3-bisphosphoglycerate-independent phosphoglycerate mutase [Xanthomonadales bacterium]|nr:2,3-bisphosphoglycerate-independent phosphoglycerate mutase [Xanthomonadales bacterium]
MKTTSTPLVLMIIDGWGYREPADDNAISLANTPCWDQLWAQSSHCLLNTSGEAVGLPAGQMGNSEVGHMNIGAGRIVYQDFTRITQAISDGSFFENPALTEAMDVCRANQGTVHIMGLLSPGGVHSHDDHFLATVDMAQQRGINSIAVHGFLDGRDTPPRSAQPSIRRMQEKLDDIEGARFCSIGGRYFAMDRDQRWERIEQAYRAISKAESELHADSATESLQQAYEREENDEFVQPTIIGDYQGMADGDLVIFVNFRADRARQLSRAFVETDFEGFERPSLALSGFVTMTEYIEGLPARVAFPPEDLKQTLGEVLSQHGLRQLRIAETEKYAHVTFFLNGGREQAFEGEQRILVPSPKVATYDLQPEMSAPELSEKLDEAIRSGQFDVIICNVANPDMVGHSGKLDAAIKAVEAVDDVLGTVAQAIRDSGGELLITSDHGNVEQMRDDSTGQTHTAHTTNPVPFVHFGSKSTAREHGALRDIAPTMLYLLDMEAPSEMSGATLLKLDER